MPCLYEDAMSVTRARLVQMDRQPAAARRGALRPANCRKGNTWERGTEGCRARACRARCKNAHYYRADSRRVDTPDPARQRHGIARGRKSGRDFVPTHFPTLGLFSHDILLVHDEQRTNAERNNTYKEGTRLGQNNAARERSCSGQHATGSF